MDNEYTHKRLSQTGDGSQNEVRDLLAAASNVARRVLASIQALAGTTHCKGVQIHALQKFAIETGCWFEDSHSFGTFSDRGSENEVYLSLDGTAVIKLNDFRYADDNLMSFFERIEIHNRYFSECRYTLRGFSKNHENKVCAVLEQPFIPAKREATEEEIAETLALMGFTSCFDGDYFTNGQYDIFDALPNNVLVGKDDELYFIDTIIYRTSDHNNDLYKTLSPRFSSYPFIL